MERWCHWRSKFCIRMEKKDIKDNKDNCNMGSCTSKNIHRYDDESTKSSRNSLDRLRNSDDEEKRNNILTEFLSYNIDRKYINIICSLCRDFFDAKDCFVTFIYKTHEYLYAGIKKGIMQPRENSLSNIVLQVNELIINNDCDKYKEIFSNNHYPDLKSYIGIVLHLNDVKVGTLCLMNHKASTNDVMRKLNCFVSLVEKNINMAYTMCKMNTILQSNVPNNKTLTSILHRSKSSFDACKPELKFSYNGICFIDIINFSQNFKDPEHIAFTLHSLISEFDLLAEKFSITKVRTIGDGYFACCGLNDYESIWDTNSYREISLRLILFASACINVSNIKYNVDLRIGLHIGECYYGIIGQNNIQFDLFGESINFAARLEQTCVINKIHISEELYRILIDDISSNDLIVKKQFTTMKNMGKHTTYLLNILCNEMINAIYKELHSPKEDTL